MAPAKEVPRNSGTTASAGAVTSRWPAVASAPATRPVTDLDTDMSRWGTSGRSPLKYRSATTRPRWMTRKPSV